MDIEDFENMIDQFGENISNLDNTLLGVVGRLVAEMKRRAPVDTGDLRRSIQGTIRDNQISFQMVYYGMFQNYGVSGTEDSLGVRVPEGVFPRPRNGNNYAFGVRKTGLERQVFFDLDYMAEEIANEIANRATDNL